MEGFLRVGKDPIIQTCVHANNPPTAPALSKLFWFHLLPQLLMFIEQLKALVLMPTYSSNQKNWGSWHVKGSPYLLLPLQVQIQLIGNHEQELEP